MNTFLNYTIEANIALILILLIYKILLKNETNFKLVRGLLLTGIGAAIIFPLIHFNTGSGSRPIPSLSNVVPSYWLPEFVVSASSQAQEYPEVTSMWSYISTLYVTGLFIALLFFIYQIFQLWRFTKKGVVHFEDKIKVIELP